MGPQKIYLKATFYRKSNAWCPIFYSDSGKNRKWK